MSKKRGERGLARDTIDLIDAAVEILEEQNPMTVRGVCYQLFGRKLIPSMSRKETARISRILVTARERGMVDWSWIVDESRNIERAAQWRDIQGYSKAVVRSYRKDYWATSGYNVIVISEKSTIGGVLRPVIDEYGISFLSVHGFNSCTKSYELAQAIASDERSTYVLYCGDFDPSGCFMSEVDLPKRLLEYGAYRGPAIGGPHLLRLAVTLTDLDRLQTFEADEKTSDPRYEWFTTEHGETCAEIDAMPPNELRDRVAGQIEMLIDREKWERHKLAEKAEIETIKSICQRMVA